LSVDKGELNQAHGIYAIVEGLYFRLMEVVIVLFVRITDHIEISMKQPGRGGVRGDGSQLLQKGGPKFRGRGSVNVCDEQRKVRASGGEMRGDGMGS
jgi:hypothetical protein